MAFDIFDRQPGACSGEFSIGQAGKAVEIWTLVADNYNYTTEDVRNSGVFPEVYTTFHAQNPRLRLQPIEVAQDADNPALFICTVTWSSEKLDPKEKDEEEDSPLDRRPRITVKTGHMKEVKHIDVKGKEKVNTAGDLFDPPIESNASYVIITIRKNVVVFPDWVFEFSDAVNSEDFDIKGRTILAGHAWIASIELGEENTDGAIAYCEATIEIHVKKKREARAEGEDEEDIPTPWKTEVLNEGLIELVPKSPSGFNRVRVTVMDDSVPPASINSPGPVPLDEDGAKLDPVTIYNAFYVVFQDHLELDFNDISYLWSVA